jgi:hypothetical protein
MIFLENIEEATQDTGPASPLVASVEGAFRQGVFFCAASDGV